MLTPLLHSTAYIIIPVYNESSIITKVVEELSVYGYSIVIVDDGSTEKFKPVFSQYNKIYFIQHKVNLGQGAAIQTGIDFALQKKAAYLVTFDGDGQHLASEIERMLLPLQRNEADITLASRFLEAGYHNATGFRQLILKIGTWVNYLFTGLYLSDSHNGLRAMNSKAASLLQLKENRMAHATEILFSIRQAKLKYKEIPATVTYTAYSRNKGQSAFSSIRIFFDLVLHKLFE